MRIEIKMVDVETKSGKTGKPYKVVEVTYKNDRGETKAYKHFDFNGQAMFDTLTALEKGDVVDVQYIKNEKGFLDWTEVTKGSAEPSPSKDVTNAGKPEKSYFIPDDEKQKLIVRQSSLANAVNFHKGDEGATLGDIFGTAGEMFQFVYGTLPSISANDDSYIPV